MDHSLLLAKEIIGNKFGQPSRKATVKYYNFFLIVKNQQWFRIMFMPHLFDNANFWECNYLYFGLIWNLIKESWEYEMPIFSLFLRILSELFVFSKIPFDL